MAPETIDVIVGDYGVFGDEYEVIVNTDRTARHAALIRPRGPNYEETPWVAFSRRDLDVQVVRHIVEHVDEWVAEYGEDEVDKIIPALYVDLDLVPDLALRLLKRAVANPLAPFAEWAPDAKGLRFVTIRNVPSGAGAA